MSLHLSPRVLLPADRPMTAEERAGFRMACACFATWGRQLADAPRTGDDDPMITPWGQMQTTGRTVVSMAAALDIRLGQGRTGMIPVSTRY